MPKSSDSKLNYQRGYDKQTGYAAQSKYMKERVVRVCLSFGDKDAAIVEKLNSVENKTDYIRRLILSDIENH